MNADQSNANGAMSAELSISGMTCSGCANTVKRVLSRVPGVTNVDVDLDKGAAVVAGTAGGPALVAAVVAAGYEAKCGDGGR
jgi:copper chaperone